MGHEKRGAENSSATSKPSATSGGVDLLRDRVPAAIIVLAVLAPVYFLARGALIASIPGWIVVEYPLALLGCAYVLKRRVKRIRRQPVPPLPSRHQQVVRTVPDPEVESTRRLVDGWLAKGARRGEVAALLTEVGPTREPTSEERAHIERALPVNAKPKARERALKAYFKHIDAQPPLAGSRAPPSKESSL